MKFEVSRSRAARVRIAMAAAAATAAVFAVGSAPAMALTTNLTDLEINEVESNDDSVNGDWIELTNTGSIVNDEIDLSGVILSDSDNSHKIVIASGTHLAKKAYLAIRVDNPAVTGNFGLGSADSARVFAPNANLASATPVDSYSWTSHAPTTYGASPDGSQNFVPTATSTFGAQNNFTNPSIIPIPGIKLNEVESNGDTTHGDWVELYNTNSTGSVNISGAIITDSDPAHQFVVPPSTSLAAGGYIAFEVEDDFGLGAADSVKLYAPGDVTLGTIVDQFSWSSHAANTYGRNVAGGGIWVPTSGGTFGAVNTFSGSAPSLTGIVINEAESHGDDTHGDWVELKNTTGSSVVLTDAIISDSDNSHVFRVPATTLAAGSLAAFRVDDPALGDGQFGLGDNDRVRLFKADATDLALATPVDTTPIWTTHAVRTYGLNGSGVWTSTNGGTFGTLNTFGGSITADLSDVVLNEIVTTGDSVHGDWVELLNTSSSTVDISGAVIRDGSCCNFYTIPNGTTLAPNGTAGNADIYVLQTENTALFGLGKPDAVRFFRTGASTIPVDHNEWDEHPLANAMVNPFASYARQANGMGTWITDTSPTYGTAN